MLQSEWLKNYQELESIYLYLHFPLLRSRGKHMNVSMGININAFLDYREFFWTPLASRVQQDYLSVVSVWKKTEHFVLLRIST